MQKCDICKTEGHYKLRCIKPDTWACMSCVYETHNDPIESGHYVKEMVKCGDMWVSKKQVAELERRVILPYNAPDNGYYVGRRGENGKIQERHPRYES